MPFLEICIWNWVKQKDSVMQASWGIEGCFSFGYLEADVWYAEYFLFRLPPLPGVSGANSRTGHLGTKSHCAERIQRLTLRTTGKPRRPSGTEPEMSKTEWYIETANICWAPTMCQICISTLWPWFHWILLALPGGSYYYYLFIFCRWRNT